MRQRTNKEIIKVTLDQREISYGQGISILPPAQGGAADFGVIYNSTSIGCTSYIDCLNAEEIIITVPVLTTTPTQGIVFYDSNKVAIVGSGILRPQGGATGKATITITKSQIPSTAYYFRATYWNFTNAQTYGDFSCVISYQSGFLGYDKYRPFQSGQIHFSVKVNQSVSNFWDSAATNQEPESFKASTGVLILPDSYKTTGKKTKVIMYCHGMSRNVSYQQWGLNDADFLAQKERFRVAGFAVFDCNGPYDSAGAAVYANGAPQSIDAYRQSYEYIKDNYNVEDKVYVIGGSMGGVIGLNYCFSNNDVKALALLSPWTSLYYCAWGQNIKDPFVLLYGFADTTTYEPEKVLGHDPWVRIKTIDSAESILSNKIPTKLWIGSLESASVLYPYALDYMTALRNGGNDAQTRLVTGAEHNLVSGGSTVVDAEVITWFNKH